MQQGPINTHFDAKLLLTSTIPTLHPLYMALAITLLATELDPWSSPWLGRGDMGPAFCPSPLGTSGCKSSRSEFFAFRLPCLRCPGPDDEPSSTSSMGCFEGERAVIPVFVGLIFTPILILLLRPSMPVRRRRRGAKRRRKEWMVQMGLKGRRAG